MGIYEDKEYADFPIALMPNKSQKEIDILAFNRGLNPQDIALDKTGVYYAKTSGDIYDALIYERFGERRARINIYRRRPNPQTFGASDGKGCNAHYAIDEKMDFLMDLKAVRVRVREESGKTQVVLETAPEKTDIRCHELIGEFDSLETARACARSVADIRGLPIEETNR